MFIPNPNSENIFVFDNVADFAEAVRRFVRGVNVFWKSGTTYDMMTSYAGGALVGAKYTVDENGASETPGGGGYDLIVRQLNGGSVEIINGTYTDIRNKLLSGGTVTGVYNNVNSANGEQKSAALTWFYYYESTEHIFASGVYAQAADLYTVFVDISPDNTATAELTRYSNLS